LDKPFRITTHNKPVMISGKNLCFVLQAPDLEIAGGVIGATHWDWFYINLIWGKRGAS